MQSVNIARLSTTQPDFQTRLQALLAFETAATGDIEARVREIIAAVRSEGDAALLRYTNALDRRAVAAPAELELPTATWHAALAQIAPGQRTALERAAARVRAYAERQRLESWSYTEPDGTVLGQIVTPLDRVGLYVPGGRAAYPSSVLMNAIPAKVAGVGELVMVVPAPDETLNPLVLAAAAVAGVDRIFTIGGAQAVAALAYGTATVPAVDKIVGPGNAYVATAKRLVYGQVGIDMIAGPSEVVIIADDSADPRWLATDLFAQAEHDVLAQSILLTPDADLIERVAQTIAAELPGYARAGIITASLAGRGALIQTRDLAEAAAVANHIAPEHLELAVRDPQTLAGAIRHAGALFLGHHSAEALGDYCAGPNHVLPTGRTARFSSPLGVYDFQKRSSLIHCSAAGAAGLAATASVLAEGEGLGAHARSAALRAGGN